MPQWLENFISDAGGGIADFFYDSGSGKLNYGNLIKSLGLYGLLRAKDSETISDFLGTSKPEPRGYQKGIPELEYKRELLPNAFAQSYTMPATEEGGLPTVVPRRPGSGGRYYFTQGRYQPKVPTTPTAEDGGADVNAQPADSPMDNQARNQAYINRVFGTLGTGVGNSPDREDYTEGFPSLAGGGLASLDRRGYYLGGTTDGMADLVPATIDGTQPAALSDGEFVIPADVVSHLGNGNSDAGAKQLYSMMDRVRQERTGTTKQGPEINPTKMMPA